MDVPKIKTDDVVRVAVIATLTVLAWETLATVGIFDWRSIPERIGVWLGPRAATSGEQEAQQS